MTLKDGLNKMTLDDLMLYSKEYNVKEDSKRIDVINKLDKDIIKSFNKFMDNGFNLDIYSSIMEINKDGHSSDEDIEEILIENMYALFKNENDLYVPDELIDIINNKLNDKEYVITLIRYVVICYLKINLIMPISFFMDNYINKYNLNININDIVNEYISIKDNNIYFDNDNYDTLCKIYDDIDKDLDYRVLSMYDLLRYQLVLNDLYNDLKEVLDGYLLELVNFTFIYDSSAVEGLDHVIEDKKVKKKVLDIYYKYEEYIRYIYHKGRNSKDISLDYLISIAPSKVLNINEVIKLNELDIDKERVIDLFNKVDERYIWELEEVINKEANYDNYNEELLYLGFIYISKVNNKYVYTMPKEIEKLLNELKELRMENVKKFNYIYNYELDISKYIDLNGIIKKKDLANFMNVSINDLERLCKHFRILFDKDYVYDKAFDVPCDEKDNFYKKYKTYDKYKNINDVDISLKEELDLFLSSHDIEKDECLIDDLYYYINFNDFNKNNFKSLLNEHDIILSNKELSDYYKELEDIIITCPLWYLNGYSKIELGVK